MSNVLWKPSADRVAHARMTNYVSWLRSERGHDFADYDSLWRWSVNNLPEFWESIWDYFGVRGARSATPLASASMPFANWFPGAQVNYAEHLLAHDGGDRPAIIALAEDGPARTVSWDELRRQAGSVAAWLLDAGIGPGDRVASYLPNIPEAIVAFAAAASVGATWSSCASEFGVPSVLDRFRQIEPKVLLVPSGYWYGGRFVDKRAEVDELCAGLPSVERVVHVPYPTGSGDGPGHAVPWDEVAGGNAPWTPRRVAFDHPLWILYSSGTTGLPKAIVHGHGGILLEHLKSHGLHLDLHPEGVYFWYTNTGWVMWNLLTAGLLTGSTIVVYDGNPAHPSLDVLWSMAERLGVTVLGGSASLYAACMKAGLSPGADHDLSALRCVGSTGSPLTTDTFRWLYRQVKDDVWVMSFSGGTDVATAFVGGHPLLPVREGELQCRWLGVDAAALDDYGNPTDGVGELVIHQPMPSMPLRLVGDTDGSRYRESYFATYTGRWRHGDWIELTPSGGAVIHGRSDATINRRGVRMGTAELYRVLERIPEVGASYLVAFVVTQQATPLDDALVRRLRDTVRSGLSPRHVPDDFVAVPAVPRTLNGKKLEVPVKRILLGEPADRVVSADAMANPESLVHYQEIAASVRARGALRSA